MTVNYIWTLTGGEFQAGNALNNTQTDQFQVYGAGNMILSLGGNLIVNGGNLPPYGGDTTTTIMLEPTSGVTDTMKVDGWNNSLVGLGPLSDSTVTFTVMGVRGGNTVNLDNSGGTTTISMLGPDNSVTLNGDATNSISSPGGTASVTVGSPDDNLFGYSTTIGLGGTDNTVNGGDENFSVSGGQGTVVLGDGTDNVSMTGTGNSVTVGGGNDSITAGGSDATVAIRGVDSLDSPSYTPDAGDGPVPPSPTDYVIIAGSGDKVSATYENVTIWGIAVTAAATITLGDGNNLMALGGTGGNKVTVGDGANAINATGNSSTYNLGDGPNGVVLSGNSNIVSVTDPTGVGLDYVQLGAGSGDTVLLDHAAGSLTGTTTGTTTVTQTGPNAVTVYLPNGIGNISLGDGKDIITTNGASSVITAGNGNDDVAANGNGDKITLGSGNNIVVANGNTDTMTFGNGNNTVTAHGNTDTMTFGSGSNTVTALGSGDHITMSAATTSTDMVMVGSADTVRITNGTDILTANGAGDIFYLNNSNFDSAVNAFGNSDSVFLGTNSSALIHLNPAGVGEAVTVQSLGGLDNYSGIAELTGFGPSDTMDLQSLIGGLNGAALNSFASVLANMTFGATSDTLHLHGGGSVIFDSPTAFTTTEFAFSHSSGPV